MIGLLTFVVCVLATALSAVGWAVTGSSICAFGCGISAGLAYAIALSYIVDTWR